MPASLLFVNPACLFLLRSYFSLFYKNYTTFLFLFLRLFYNSENAYFSRWGP
jgi:hypothetical protein